MRKSSERLRCCFCGDDTAAVPDANYVELEVTFPADDGDGFQLFGAHVECFDRQAAPGFDIFNVIAESA